MQNLSRKDPNPFAPKSIDKFLECLPPLLDRPMGSHQVFWCLFGLTKTLAKADNNRITCDHCGQIYIGQTKRILKNRSEDHIAEVTKANKDTDKELIHNFKTKVAEDTKHIL